MLQGILLASIVALSAVRGEYGPRLASRYYFQLSASDLPTIIDGNYTYYVLNSTSNEICLYASFSMEFHIYSFNRNQTNEAPEVMAILVEDLSYIITDVFPSDNILIERSDN